jgi:DNA polymerase-3 subunit alpha
VNLGGIVTELQIKTTKKGGRFGLMRIEDKEGGVKCVMWPEVFSKFEKTVGADAAVLVRGKLEVEETSATIIVDEVVRLEDVLQRKARSVVIRLPAKNEYEPFLNHLFKLFDEHKGDCEILLEMMVDGNMLVRARPHSTLRVRGSLDLESALHAQGCKVEWVNVTLN